MRPMDTLPTDYARFIHQSRYARWIESEGRRETWPETVKRYFDYMERHLKENNGYILKPELRRELEMAVLNLEVMPSMRALMTAGPALDWNNVCAYNCFSGETEYMTKEGLKTFKETVGTRQTVLCEDGEWREAEIRSFGRQPLNRIEFRPGKRSRSNLRYVVYATPNHRWITQRGTVDDLRVGDLVPFNPAPITPFDAEDFARGFGFGDGSTQDGFSRVRLCGDKARHLSVLQKAGRCNVTYPPSAGGDPFVIYGKGVLCDWKALPRRPSWWWFQGYLAADGHNQEQQPGVSTQDPEAAEFVLKNAAYGGFMATGHNLLTAPTNFGARSAPLHRITLRTRGEFRVVSIEETGLEEEVFCAVEPVTQSFTLAGGILTRNCSYLPVDHPWAFDEAMYVLMNGTGVGYSVESRYVDQLPMVPRKIVQSDDVIVVEDSKEGWCYGLRALIEGLYEGRQRPWNLSYVRPAGARLKTFGGRASGPEPLNKLFEFTVKLFNAARGRKLRTIEAHDLMCKIAEIVVVGGVRRSAMISLSDLDDKRMQVAKSGQWWDIHPERALANNSYVLEGRPDMSTFLGEMKALYDSHSGERGIFSRAAAIKQALKYGRRDPNFEFGTNPCSEIILRPYQFCVSGDTPLITRNGLSDIKDLVDTEVEVWNGRRWSKVTVRKTGTGQKLVRVRFSDGSYLDCTPDHRFSVKDRFGNSFKEVQAQDLMKSKYAVQIEPTTVVSDTGVNVADAYDLGVACGDGHVDGDRVHIHLYGPKISLPVAGVRGTEAIPPGYNVPRVSVKTNISPERLWRLRAADGFRDLFSWDRASVLAFVAGLADTDGSETGTGGIRIYLSQEKRARMLQLLLTKNGIRSSVCLLQKSGRETNYGVRKEDLWYLQITDARELPCHRLDTSKGHAPRFKGQYQTVRSVEELPGLHDTYCFNEPEEHKGLFANVLTFQCNLSEVVVRPNDTTHSLTKKVRYATILGTFQATLTNFRYLRPIWKQNTEEERLLGVSMTGIMDCNLTNGRTKGLPELLTVLRQVAVDTNETYARALGIHRSAAITCVKPSGTVSQLVDAASGIHPRYAPFYIRTVRADNKDPMTRFLRDQGVPAEPCVTFPDSVTIFSFPVKSPYGALTRNDLSAIEHLNLWLTYQRFWCEHKPSVTIYYGVDEFPEVQSWVWKHLDEVSGISFLPRDDHVYKQAPYQPVSEKEFLAAQARSPARIEWERLREYETEDTTTGTQELACSASGEGCELVDIG